MADSGERRMLFDTRGRRRNVIRVVYATLAILMGGSLFLTVGPFSIGELFGTGGSGDAAEVFDDQVERIEGRLAKNPQDEGMLLALTRARISAANAKLEIDPQTGTPGLPSPEALDDYEAALETWNRYLNQVSSEPNPAAAQLVASTFFGLAERGSATLSEVEENLDVAVQAQQIVADQRPSVGTLSALAIYEFFDYDYAAGERATREAVELAASKPEAKSIEKQMAEYRKRAEQYERRTKQIAKAEQKAGGEQPQNPFGGFGPGAPPPGE